MRKTKNNRPEQENFQQRHFLYYYIFNLNSHDLACPKWIENWGDESKKRSIMQLPGSLQPALAELSALEHHNSSVWAIWGSSTSEISMPSCPHHVFQIHNLSMMLRKAVVPQSDSGTEMHLQKDHSGH